MISDSSCWMEKIKRVDCLWKRWGLYQVYMLPSISCANPFPPSSCLNQAVIWAPKCELATCDPCKSGNHLLNLTTCHDEGEIWGLKKYCIQFHIKPCLLVWLSALALPWSMSRLSRQSPCTSSAGFFRDQKYSTRPAGRSKVFFRGWKVFPAVSRVASCYQQQDQMHAAQIAQIGRPPKNYLQSSATSKMQLQVAFPIHSTLALFVWS